jgi:LysR family glycine cleavage system transcriptional activator
MSYRLPPLNGLRAFEAAARHLSFKRAADELCVTPGAVSQQVKVLELAIGQDLFRRLPRSLVLTPVGEAYVPSISAAFHAISTATEAAAPALQGRRLRLAVASRIMAASYPAVAQLSKHKRASSLVNVTVSDDLAGLLAGQFDALLRAAGGTYPGFHSERVDLRTTEGTAETAVLVTVPGLAGCREHSAVVKLLRGGS